MKYLKKINIDFDNWDNEEEKNKKKNKRLTRQELQELYDRASLLYPNLEKINDGTRNYFWIGKKRKRRGEPRDNDLWLFFGISIGKDGVEHPLVRIKDFVKNDFIPENVTPGQLIDMYFI